MNLESRVRFSTGLGLKASECSGEMSFYFEGSDQKSDGPVNSRRWIQVQTSSSLCGHTAQTKCCYI